MPPSGDAPDHWDVLPSPIISEGPAPAGPDTPAGPAIYRPPATGDPDPITLVGKPGTIGQRIRRALVRGVLPVLLFGLMFEAVAAPNVFWMVVIGVLVAAILVWMFVLIVPRPLWGPPRLQVNTETLTVTDVAGVTSSVPWEEVGRLRISLFDSDVEEVHLIWISPGGAADSTANLGNTLDVDDVRAAIEARIPPGPELIAGPRRAFKRRSG